MIEGNSKVSEFKKKHRVHWGRDSEVTYQVYDKDSKVQ